MSVGDGELLRPVRAPRGWNSFDSIGSANETQVRAAIAALGAGAVLGPTYEYVEMDGFWFNNPNEANSESLDAYGGPARFPSLNGSLGPLADEAHAAGLKLGIWQLFGVPKGAVARQLPIFGTPYTAADIALNDSVASGCGWAAWEGYSVNMSHPAGQAWYDGLVALWAGWGLDLIKLDCVFGGNWSPQRLREIEAVGLAIARSPRPMALSLSPGGDVTAHMLDQVATLATTARHAPDLHGEWYMVYPQMFQLAAKFHNRVPNASSPGLFLDLDILPFGRGRQMKLSVGEMRVVMRLWCLMRSPLLFGGDITSGGAASVPPAVAAVATNPQMLRVTDDVVRPAPLPAPASGSMSLVGWAARSFASSQVRYAAVFNIGTSGTATGYDRTAAPACRRPGSPYDPYTNDTCVHNPGGRIGGWAVSGSDACCQRCANTTAAAAAGTGGPCAAWSAFHDGKTLECNLFRSVRTVKAIAGCISGVPPPPPSSEGYRVTLRNLGLDPDAGEWEVRSVWNGSQAAAAVPVVGGGFTSRPAGHDVEMYMISPMGK